MSRISEKIFSQKVKINLDWSKFEIELRIVFSLLIVIKLLIISIYI